ncbi:hypothetical protein GALL_405120 [mine drainage metagenome]|uniref:Uncharacterized protein n=1 Tax=mine drainage metagenome TaxID=410659 RepID=A0A1J5Q265_9ZZZZ
MVDQRQRVVDAQAHAGALEHVRRGQPRRVQRGVGQRGQFGQVAADEAAVGVELATLRDRIEDAEPRLRVAAGRRRPLPAAVVRRQLEVVELEREMALAQLPVEFQVLAQEACDDHAQPVVHVAGGVELTHRGVDQRVAGAA